MAWQSFLSYSRQQYYSAESLVLQLQGQGLSIWFDVQQLEPGTDWQQDIQAGIDQSGTLLLLASRAALASPYVRREWQRALELGHPVVVALLESARLPRELRHAPVIDLRGDFDAAALRVQQAILDPKQPTKPVWPLPVLPRGVRQAAFALFLNDVRATGLLLLSLALWIMLFRYASLPRLVLDVALKMFQQLAGSAWSLEQFAPWLLVGGLLLVSLRLISAIYETRFTRLLRRDIKRSLLLPPRQSKLGLPLWLWLALASGYLDMVTANYTSNGIGPAPLPLLAAFAVVFLLLWRLNRIAKRLLPHLPNLDLLRWAVIGGVPDDWRTQLYRGLSLTPLAAGQGADLPATVSTDLRMRAVVETPDLPVLEALRPLIRQVGAVIEDSADSTNYDLLILSHASSRRRVAAVLQERKHILGVIASRFRVPRELEALGSVQLVDFSRHDSMGVIAALRLLTARDDSERSHLQPYLEPVNLAQVALPNIPTALADCLLSLVLLTLIMLGLLIMQGTSLENPLPAEAALAVTVLLLLAVNEPVRRGRRPMPRWGLLILAFLPLILISLSALQLPFDVNIAGLALYPVGWLYLLGTVTLTVARCVILLLHHPQALGSADSFGMPPLPLPLRATFAWLGACILLLSLVIGPNIQLLNS